MGETDIKRQAPNVFKMKLLGAEIRSVKSGTATLKDAMNEALRDWVSNVNDTFYVIGTVAGPHPYPMMVRDFSINYWNRSKKSKSLNQKKNARLINRLHWRGIKCTRFILSFF